MNRWSVLLVLVTIFALGLPVGEARKMVIVHRGGDASHGWLTMKVVDIHKFFNEGLGFVMKTRELIPNYDWQLPGQTLHNSLTKEIPQSFLCDSCMDISAFMEQVLTDPDTINSVLEYVNGSLCKNLPEFQSKCLDIAEMYVPSVVETLQIYAAPNKLCGETKLCPSSAMLLMNDARTCKMCKEFAKEALSYAKNDATETQILEALHAQCAKLVDFSSRCNLLVDTYVPIYFSKLDSTTPDEICEKVGMCSCQSMKDPTSCATCEFAVFQMKAKLRNPQVQEKMLETLFNQCSKVANYVDQCKEIVGRYGPHVLANLDMYLNAEAICTDIHACESKPQLADDILIQLPSSNDDVNDGVAHL